MTVRRLRSGYVPSTFPFDDHKSYSCCSGCGVIEIVGGKKYLERLGRVANIRQTEWCNRAQVARNNKIQSSVTGAPKHISTVRHNTAIAAASYGQQLPLAVSFKCSSGSLSLLGNVLITNII